MGLEDLPHGFGVLTSGVDIDTIISNADNQTDADLQKAITREQKDNIEANRVIYKFN